MTGLPHRRGLPEHWPVPRLPDAAGAAAPDRDAAGLPSGTGVAGSYRFEVLTGRWYWSNGLYRIYGFAPHELAPSTSLLLSRVHPDDLRDVDGLLEEAMTGGAPVLLHYRMTDGPGKCRIVVMAARPWRTESGRVCGLEGFVWDMTPVRTPETGPAAREAVEQLLLHQAEIEQAKGILMLHYHVSAAKAFAVLSHLAQQTNRKLWSVAGELIDIASSTGASHGESSALTPGTAGPGALDAGRVGTSPVGTVTDIRVRQGRGGTGPEPAK